MLQRRCHVHGAHSRNGLPVYDLSGNILCVGRNSQQKFRMIRLRIAVSIFDEPRCLSQIHRQYACRQRIQRTGMTDFFHLVDAAHLTYYIVTGHASPCIIQLLKFPL